MNQESKLTFNPLKKRIKADGNVEDMLFAGENVYIGGHLNEGGRITIDDIKQGISIVEDMPNFISFVEVFNNQTGFTERKI